MLAFDEAGITRRLTGQGLNKKLVFPIHSNWTERRKQFLDQIDDIIAGQLSGIVLFGTEPDKVSGTGRTTFFVEKVGALQKYRISSSDGYVLLRKEADIGEIETKFQLINTIDSVFSINLSQIYFSWKFHIHPVFEQFYRVDPKTTRSLFNLSTSTVVRFFPVIDIGDTIYLVQDGEKFVPICYGVYSTR